jgi:hypothetical protein
MMMAQIYPVCSLFYHAFFKFAAMIEIIFNLTKKDMIKFIFIFSVLNKKYPCPFSNWNKDILIFCRLVSI